VNAAVAVEAIRTAQAKFGQRPLNGEEGRWGLEHLNIDDARLKAMGYLGLMQNLKLSCRDHEGGGSARVQQWDGAKLDAGQRLDRRRPRAVAPADRRKVRRVRQGKRPDATHLHRR